MKIYMSNRITIECYACGREFTKLIPKEKSKMVFDILDVVEVFKSTDRLQMAIDEVKRGDTVKYDSVEDMMKDLRE